MDNKINIAFAINNDYTEQCCTVIASILKNSRAYFHFHILERSLSDSDRDIIKSLKKNRDFDIDFYDMDKFNLTELPLKSNWISSETYFRLLLPRVIPGCIDKILYLDCDIIVKGDLKNLYDTNLEENYFGAVLDECYKSLGRHLDLEQYFNAGVILFNLNLLRKIKIDILKKCIDYYRRNSDKIIHQDQDLLNVLYSEKTKYLPYNYNVCTPIYLYRHRVEWSESGQKEALLHPVIIHYTGPNKPWLNAVHPKTGEYYNYLKYTPYRSKYIKYRIDQFINFFKKFFSVRNKTSYGKIHKVITILCLKFKFRNRAKEREIKIEKQNQMLLRIKSQNEKILKILEKNILSQTTVDE